MSDVGLSADLALDIRSALEQVARLERSLDAAAHVTVIADDTRQVTGAIDAAVTAADTAVTVTGEANELTGDVTSAIDAADSAVTVTGDASELTGDVTGAVDAGDSHVEVTGDASQVTGAVTSAVDDADTAVTITGDADEVTGPINAAVQNADHTVQIEADTRGLQEATAQSDQLTESIGGAAIGAGVLKDNLGLIGGAVSVGGILKATNAASDLAESQSKANVVFGDGVGEVNRFADAAAQATGLSKQAALEAEATFGNLFLALGSTRQEATRLAPSVVQLAADLASFNNIGVDEALEKLRSGLVGEIEPLRSLGISFNANQVEAEAMALGLADANGQVSEGAKIQARWALILQQSTTAQGDFARTSTGLANQQRILAAEIENAVTEIGQAFLPTMLDLVSVARDAIPDIVRLAEAVGPVLSGAARALVPVLSGAISVLGPLGTVASTVADVVGAIPPPVLQMVGAFLALRAATS